MVTTTDRAVWQTNSWNLLCLKIVDFFGQREEVSADGNGTEMMKY